VHHKLPRKKKLACLLSINAINAMSKTQSLQHEVAARLKQLSNNAIWLFQIPLNQQHSTASL